MRLSLRLIQAFEVRILGRAKSVPGAREWITPGELTPAAP